MLSLPLESAARLLSLLLHLLLHLLLRPESLLLLASVATLWAAARHGPRLRSLPTSACRSLRRFASSRGPSPPSPPAEPPPPTGGPPCPPPAAVPWGGGRRRSPPPPRHVAVPLPRGGGVRAAGTP
ncbi:uncharacterized protein LOC144952436 [Lampetra fluviatilis]